MIARGPQRRLRSRYDRWRLRARAEERAIETTVDVARRRGMFLHMQGLVSVFALSMPRRLVRAALALALLCSNGKALACTCSPAGDRANAANLALVGDVTSVTREQGQLRATLHVQRFWKDATGANVEILTPDIQGRCGLPLVEQQRWLIFAKGSRDGGFADACSGSARFELDDAKLASLELLGKTGQTPTAQPPSGAHREGGCAACTYARGVQPKVPFVLVFALGGFGVLRYRRSLERCRTHRS